MNRRIAILAALALAATLARAADGELRIASIGDLPLESGEVLPDCRVEYRLWGTPSDGGANVVVVTTWFGGTTAGLVPLIGDGKLFDTSRFSVIAIGALADGGSSSPSNHTSHPGTRFPRVTIGDMVRSQHALLTRVLGLDRVHAVAGLSMGGMQAFEWIVAYPEFMDRAVPIAGTPRQTSHDLILWKTELDLIEATGGDEETMRAVARLNLLEIRTPAWIAREIERDELDAALARQEEGVLRIDPRDYAAQLRAMIDHDVYRSFGGSMQAAAEAVRAKVLVVVATQDQMVRPEPSAAFTRALGAALFELTGDCGHLATACEGAALAERVTSFLEE
ncbi:MAG: alpha/beta fold hydrolase [Thermoanaerobaculia bacterium]